MSAGNAMTHHPNDGCLDKTDTDCLEIDMSGLTAFFIVQTSQNTNIDSLEVLQRTDLAYLYRPQSRITTSIKISPCLCASFNRPSTKMIIRCWKHSVWREEEARRALGVGFISGNRPRRDGKKQ